MKDVILASKNKGKAKELVKMLSRFDFTVKTLLDFPDFPDIEETGETFEENAVIKAEAVCRQTGCIAIADDSGLIVDALDGRPGVFSARYAGEEKDDEANIDKVLDELQGVPLEERTARFYCALAIAFPNGETKVVSGTCEGMIINERRGDNGFGYDPIFYVETYGKTTAELPPDVKNQISHRARALKQLESVFTQVFSER